MSNVNVFVVGAGPSGLIMALQALRAGLSVRVIDRAPGRSQFSKAIGLQYRVSEILSQLGLAERFISAGTAPARVRMYAEGRSLLTLSFFDFSALAGRGAFAPVAIMIPQSETERLLGGALTERGGQVEWLTELESISESSTGITATLRYPDGRLEHAGADWLVGCDGAHSAVRKLLGLGFEGKSLPLSFAIADVEGDWPDDRDCVHVWFHGEGSAAAMPLPADRRWRLFLETTRQPAGTVLTFADMVRLVHERTGVPSAGEGRCLWQSEFRINCRMAERLGAGRVFLVGDAAHIHSPTGGQGIATGAQDASNLAWKLGQVHRGAPASLLETYAAERLPEIRRVLEETDRNTQLFIAPTLPLRLLRDWAVLPMLRSTSIQRKLVRRLSQLDVSYRRSDLSRHIDDRRWHRGMRIRAGDRAPDVLFASFDGKQPVSIFSALRDGRLLALIRPGPQPVTSISPLARALDRLGLTTLAIVEAVDTGIELPCRRVRDQRGEFERLYGTKEQCLVIVRPDGHVGLVQRPIRPAQVGQWLARLCDPAAVARELAPLRVV